MMWHCCHSFTKSLKPRSRSRDKMRLVPLNTQETLKLIPRSVRQRKSGVALRFPPHFFHTCSSRKERKPAHLARFERLALASRRLDPLSALC